MARMIGRFLALAALATAPAAASVKDGVEAWARGDFKAAVEQWRGPAIAGDPDAQFNMGQAYKLGRGVEVDLTQAELWYARAAAQGHAPAQDNYGLALAREGKRAEALPWLEKSVARDEKRTELVLGTMLFNGDGVAKDWVRAYALVSRSSQQGLAPAGQTLAQMDAYLSPMERQQGLAMATDIEMHARAAQAGISPRAAAAVASEGAAVPPQSAPKKPVHPVPLTKPAVAVTPPKPAVPSRPGGRWKVQLGAFREPGGAQALWARVGGKVGGQPSYVKAGAITRLQAGPFASREDAEKACRASGVSCVAVP